MMKNLERKTINQLNRNEQICLYLKDHPEALTEDLMIEVAARLMNVAYIRYMIRRLYQQIVKENIKKNNFVIVPDHYEE
jgi:hypothetical protein